MEAASPDPQSVYLKHLYDAEQTIAADLSALCKGTPEWGIDDVKRRSTSLKTDWTSVWLRDSVTP